MHRQNNGPFDDIEYWKAIILYGLNSATYKIALGKTLLDFAINNQGSINWEILSAKFLDNYIHRLSISDPFPQQTNPSRLTVIERVVKQLLSNKINYTQAVAIVAKEGLNDVIPRFQTIGLDKEIVKNKFYNFEFGKHLTLHDSIFKIAAQGINNLQEELEARWSLLEGAFSIQQNNWQLANDTREIYLVNGYNRTNLTPNIPFLEGYQGNTCFYCGEAIEKNDIHVDHLLPRQVVQHDEVWNLVLSHSHCNTLKSDNLIHNYYLEKIISRNENIMGSNHPWKSKIEHSLGVTKKQRRKSLEKQYENVKLIIGPRYWGGISGYIFEKDPFYKKLITRLNNG